MSRILRWSVLVGAIALLTGALPAVAAEQKPNIILIVSDDTDYGDLGPYGGGEGRGMPTPNIDRLAGFRTIGTLDVRNAQAARN